MHNRTNDAKAYMGQYIVIHCQWISSQSNDARELRFNIFCGYYVYTRVSSPSFFKNLDTPSNLQCSLETHIDNYDVNLPQNCEIPLLTPLIRPLFSPLAGRLLCYVFCICMLTTIKYKYKNPNVNKLSWVIN